MKDLTGIRFGYQVAISFQGYNKHKTALWLCKCDCGNEHVVSSDKLLNGKSKSCGCYRKRLIIERSTTHGLLKGGKPRLFIIWNGMKARCMNPQNNNFNAYGKRGISVCAEWEVFSNFYNWAISSGYSDGLTIDRIDNDGNYEPSNCRWVTAHDNKVKQRKTIFILGKSLSENARVLGIGRHKLTNYYRKNGLQKTEDFINKFIHN